MLCLGVLGVIKKQHECPNIEWISIADRTLNKLLNYSFNEKKVQSE